MAEKAYDYQSQKNARGHGANARSAQYYGSRAEHMPGSDADYRPDAYDRYYAGGYDRRNGVQSGAHNYASSIHGSVYSGAATGQRRPVRRIEQSRPYARDKAAQSGKNAVAQPDVRANPRPNMAKRVALALAALGVVLCLFVHVYQTSRITQRATEASQLQQQLIQLEAERQNLEVKLSRLSDVTRIERMAADLGMVYASDGQIQVLTLQ